MIATEARVAEVLEAAKDRLFAGQVEDAEALNLAYKLGYIRNVYDGPAGFLGVAKLCLTEAGAAALGELS